MHVRGTCMVGGMCDGKREACVAGEVCGGRGKCGGGMHGVGHVWQGFVYDREGMNGWMVCVLGWHVWQGVCMVGVCVAGGACMEGVYMRGMCVGGGVCMAGACTQERWPMKQAVRILLECILVFQDFTFLIWTDIFWGLSSVHNVYGIMDI